VLFEHEHFRSFNFIHFEMAHPRYPSLSLLRALRSSCEVFSGRLSNCTNAVAKSFKSHPKQSSRSFQQSSRKYHVSHQINASKTFRRSQSCVYERLTSRPAPTTTLRSFTTTASLRSKTVQEAKTRAKLGVLHISPGAALFRGTCCPFPI